jgi:hypothetical protein
MLQIATVAPETLGLLRRLMDYEPLRNFNLVGGTALALQIGHRSSYDIDLFGKTDQSMASLVDQLQVDFTNINLLSRSEVIAAFTINGVKTDIVKYPFELLERANTIDGIRLLGLKDIAAMKMEAVTNRGKKRDFTDVYFLLHHFSLEEMMDFYSRKFPAGNKLLLLRSLTYFADADLDNDVKFVTQKVSWSHIKKRISSLVHDKLRGS